MSQAVIIGGTRGIGRAVARQLAAEGWALTLIGRRPPVAADQDVECVRLVAADLAQPRDVIEKTRQACAPHGPVSALVFVQRFRGEGDAWAGEIQTTLSATKELIEGLTPLFDHKLGGAVVAVSSNAGEFVALNQPVGYHVAKAGLNQMVRYYAATLGRRNIRVNAVSPCTVLKEESRQFYLGDEALCDLYQRITPLGRMGTADEVAQAVTFLCGPKASFITGQNLYVDGGMSLLLHDWMAREVTCAA
jgi:NAD(P)-dependent dehydrogenase (short-subunit alcohol dehydrogenase family)